MYRKIVNIINFNSSQHEYTSPAPDDKAIQTNLLYLKQKQREIDMCVRLFGIIFYASLIIVLTLLLLNVFDVINLNTNILLALCLVSLGIYLIYSRSQKESVFIDSDYYSEVRNSNMKQRFYNCYHNNQLLCCYVISATEQGCLIRLITETPEGLVNDDTFSLALVSSSDHNELTLDVDKKCVFYPKDMEWSTFTI